MQHKPLKRFKISSKEHFFWCYIFKTKKDMYNWYSDYNRKRGKSHEGELNFEAIVMPYEKISSDKRCPDIGICLFYQGRLGTGLIAHEMGHCSLWYDRLINGNTNAEYGDNNGEREERLLYILYDFSSDFVNKLYKHKLI